MRLVLSVLFCLNLLRVRSQVGDYTRYNLTEAAKNKGAVCMDGSDPVFFWKPGHGSGKKKYLLFLHGGGWCAGLGEKVASGMDSCVYRTKSSRFGTSHTMPDKVNWKDYPLTFGFLSPEPEVNPAHWNWNIAELWYCDGASFSGNLDEPLTWFNTTDNTTTVMYFRGHRNLLAFMDELLSDQFGMSEAEALTIVGGSAGALGTLWNGDWMIDYIVSHNVVNPSQLRFNSGLFSNAGWFLYYESEANFTGGMSWVFSQTNASLYINSDCISNYTAQGMDPGLCAYPQYLSPFIQAPLFALQTQYDNYQTPYIAGLDKNDDEAVNEYGELLKKTFESTLFTGQTRRAGFLSSCYNHVKIWQDCQTADGSDPSTVEYTWVVDQPDQEIYEEQDYPYPCDYCCSIT